MPEVRGRRSPDRSGALRQALAGMRPDDLAGLVVREAERRAGDRTGLRTDDLDAVTLNAVTLNDG